MATYTCAKCGMGVNATCAKCDSPLENDSLDLGDGNSVQISKCPNGHGKIKSPMCCGEDMSCSL
jgi:hypothetical protein